jgi:hypothetical protein
VDVREFALGNFVSRSISGSSLISWRCDGNFLFANCIRSSPVQHASDYPAALLQNPPHPLCKLVGFSNGLLSMPALPAKRAPQPRFQ